MESEKAAAARSPSPARSPWSLGVGLALAGLFAWALALRAIFYPVILSSSQLLPPFGGDPFYHLRRITYMAANFPATLDFDPYRNFPDGALCIWPPGLDWLIAGVARLLVGGEAAGVERVAAWAPAVLGAINAVALAALLARHASPRVGIAAGFFLAVLPAHFRHSQLGYVDHHAAEGPVAVALLAAALALFTAGPRVRWGLALGVALVAALAIWPGALLHVVTVQAAVVLWALAAPSREDAAARARALAWAHALAALVLFPMGRQPPEQFGAWSPMVLSSFQPLYFGAAAAWFVAFEAIARTLPAARARSGRILAGLAAAGLGVVLTLALASGLREALLYGAGWFTGAEAVQSQIAELTPLFWPLGRFNPAPALSEFSILLLLFPLAWGWLAWRAGRDGSGFARGLLLAWSAQVFCMAMAQNRFANGFATGFVLVWALCAADVLPRLRAARGVRRFAGVAAAGVLALLCLGAVLAYFAPRLGGSLSALGQPAARERGTLANHLWLADRAARWLRSASPPTSGWLDASVTPEYGVVSSWGIGHLVRYRAQRPLVQDNFASYGGRENYDAAWAYYRSEDEDAAVDILDGLRARYVFADRMGPGSVRGARPSEMAVRLARHFGSAARGTDPQTGAAQEVAALERHRMIWYGNTARGPRLLARRPDHVLAVWEPVAGARVEGRVLPGEAVEVSLALRLPGGRRHTWRSERVADADGRFAFRVPYPTDRAFSDVVRSEGRYTLVAADRSVRFDVAEAAVRAGTLVVLPDETL